MFDSQAYYHKLTEAGLPEKQALVMTQMLKDVDTIINHKDGEQEDGHHAIQRNNLLEQA